MDYTEFRKQMRAKQALAKERRKRLLRICLDVVVMILAAALLAFIEFRVTR